MNTQELGCLAENIAARHMQSLGYEIIDRNYRKPWGEIDVIAKNKDHICFVEVKANQRQYVGDFNPEIRVDQNKLNKIMKTASLYLEYELKNSNTEWQIDIISVIFDIDNKKAKINHFKNVAQDYI